MLLPVAGKCICWIGVLLGVESRFCGASSMTTVFRRNFQVDTVADAASAIQELLTDAGWTTVSGNPTNLPLLMRSQTTVNSVFVHLRFSSPSGTTLRLNGDRLGDGTSLSANRDWTLSPGSLLWGAADGDACCLYLKPTTGNGVAYHAGRLDLVEPTDGWGWALGLLTNDPSGVNYQVAQAWNSTMVWQQADFFLGIYANIFTSRNYDGSTLINPVTGRPQLAPYFRLTSDGAFRGVVKFAVSGLAGAPAGTEWQGEDGKIYVATGAGGFRIK